jgi:hypothetical protein
MSGREENADYPNGPRPTASEKGVEHDGKREACCRGALLEIGDRARTDQDPC